jgi:hypothetical protein
MHRMLSGAIQNIAKAASGEPPEHIVNGVLKLKNHLTSD